MYGQEKKNTMTALTVVYCGPSNIHSLLPSNWLVNNGKTTQAIVHPIHSIGLTMKLVVVLWKFYCVCISVVDLYVRKNIDWFPFNRLVIYRLITSIMTCLIAFVKKKNIFVIRWFLFYKIIETGDTKFYVYIIIWGMSIRKIFRRF